MTTRHPRELQQQIASSATTIPYPTSATKEEGLPAGLDGYRVLTRKQLSQLTGLSEATHERLDAEGDGPKRIQLSARRCGYRVFDALAWLEARATNCAA